MAGRRPTGWRAARERKDNNNATSSQRDIEDADDSEDTASEVLTAIVTYEEPTPSVPADAEGRIPMSISRVRISEMVSSDLQPSKSILIKRQIYGSLLPPLYVDPDDIQMRYSSESGVFRFYKTRTKDSNDGPIPNTEAFIYMVIPPDGGYAWIVLVVAFCCHVIVDGLLYSIGSILPAIAEDLQVSSKQTALVASAQIAPLSGALINKFGFRPVAFIGGIIASMALLVASFSQQIEILIVFQGIIAGISMGMVYMATSLIINYYFERYRAVVCGVASAGTGLGMVLMNLLNANIVEKVGWCNTIRVHMLLLFITTMLTIAYRDVEPTKLGQYIELYSGVDSDEAVNSTLVHTHEYSTKDVTLKSEIEKSVTSLAGSGKLDGRLTTLRQPQKRSFVSRMCPCGTRAKRFSTPGAKRFLIEHRPLDRHDIFYDNRPDYSQTGIVDVRNVEGVEVQTGNESKARTITYTFSVIRAAPPHEENEKSCCPLNIKSAVDALFDLGLLNLATFRLIVLESFLFPMGYNIPYVYSAERAEISKHLANLLPVVIGITNIIFRLVIGFLAFKINCHTAYLSGCGMVLGGLVTLLSAFVGQSTVWFQFLFVVCFGIAAASYSAVRAIVYVKVLGLEKLTNAFGLTTMVMGLGAFIGTSIAGAMNDIFGGYSVTFAFSGIAMTTAGCLKMALPKYVKYRSKLETRAAQKKVHFADGEEPSQTCWQKCCDFV